MHVTNRKWNSLSQLMNYIEKNNKREKIIEFNGYELITNKHRYTLYQGQVNVNKPL